MKKTKKKRIVALLMAVLFSFSLGSQKVPSFAEDKTVINDENLVITGDDENAVSDSETASDTEAVKEENTTSEEDPTEAPVETSSEDETDPTEEVTEKVTTEEVTEEVTTEEVTTEEVTTEKVTTEEVIEKKATFTEPIEGVDTTWIDFSSKELLIGTEDPSIFTWDTEVVSEYNGVYLTRYESEEVTRNAYTYYYNKADFVDANVVFTVQDNEESADLSQLNEGDDAISNLNDMDAETVPSKTIAVIDTGINASDLVGSVSVLGGDASDDNGHGTRMYEYIKDECPDAKILSIKAMGSDGKGQISDVYAAIQYAIESKVDIINLSISAYSVAGSDVIENVINDAVAQGIIIVGAAGNNGKNAKYFIPGGVESAIIVGSCDDNGEILADSNYGATVDYIISSESTSEAAARMSGIIASNDGKSKSFVFTADYSVEEEIGGTVTYENGEFIIANWPGDGEPHTTTAYVQAYEIGTESAHHLKYKYYDSNNHVFDTGISFDFSEYGSVSGVNCFCLDPYAWAGRNGHEFDTDPLVEVTATSPSWVNTSLTTQQIQNVIYWALQEGGPWADDFVDYFFQYWMGRSPLMGDVSDNSSYEAFVNNNKNNSVPYGKSFKVYFIHNTASTTAPNTYQDFLTWKLEDSLDYYIAVKKVDSRGYAMNGVTFSISYHNNDTNSDVNIEGGYINSKYRGIWTGFRIDTFDTYGTSYRNTSNEGVGVFYLGKFSNAPTNVRVTEHWRGRSENGSGWDGGRAELVKSSTNRVDVFTHEYAPNSSSQGVSVWNTEADAISHAATNTFTNYRYAAVSLEKEATNKTYVTGNTHYSMTGIKYGFYGNAACTELIATVTLTDNGDGTAKIASLNDITINKTSTDNNSEPYKVTLDGKHSIAGLMWGTYYWKEISTPSTSGYALSTTAESTTVNVSNVDAPKITTPTDQEDTGKIRVHKLLTGTGSSGASPAGATYEIKGTSTGVTGITKTVTIGSNGYSDYVPLLYGTYTIKEKTVPTTAPTNGEWSIDTTTYTVVVEKNSGTKTISSSTSVTATDATVESTDTAYLNYYVSVKKVDDLGNTMNGVTFDLKVNGGTTKTKALTTGKYVNGSSVTNTTAGIATYYLGKFSSAPTVVITENWTNDGYVHNTTSKTVTAYNTKADAENHAASFLYTNLSRKYLYLTKRSSNTNCTNGNPNYSLAGATYKLYGSYNDAATALSSGNYGTALATFTVKADGTSTVNNTTATKLDVSEWMPKNPTTGLYTNKTFYLVESAAGKNYRRSTTPTAVTVTSANTSTNPAHADMVDEPVNDPFRIEIVKTDKITGSNQLPKGKTLEGATFAVDFYAADVETVLANANGDVVGYLTSHYTASSTDSTTVTITKKANGTYFANVAKTFPIGFVVIREITPPTGYSLTDSVQYLRNGDEKIDITGKLAFVTFGEFSNNQASWLGKSYYPNNATTIAELTSSTGTRHGIDVSVVTYDIRVDNTPIRGDIRLQKVAYSDGKPLKGVEFVIKNTETGETHSLFTDANGNATTVGNADTWFSKSTDADEDYPYTAGYGSLPTGTYTLTEKRSDANEGYQLLAPIEFTVTTSSTQVISASENKLYNIEMPYITTTAMDEATQSKSLAQGETGTIVDTIKYYHLRANSKFYLVGTLMVRYPDGTYEAYQKDGEPYTVTSEAINTPAAWTKSEFEIDGEYVMEFPDVDPAGYEGCSFVVFQKLYYNAVPTDDANAAQYKEYDGTDEKIFPVLHENIESEGQTVRPVDIHTNAWDGITKDNISKPEGTVTIVDRVSYTGLTKDEEYTITGTLHVTGYTWKDAEGNEIKTVDADDTLLNEDGTPVTASQTFTAESTDGYIDLEFTCDASLLAGESVVAFEELIYKDKVLALHADLKDENETIHFGNIHTTLYRGGTEEWAEDFDEDDITKVTTVDESSKEIMAAEDAVVVDRIKYHNLLANRHYIIKGVLMDKEKKEPFVDADGKTVEVTYEFDTPTVDAVEDTDTPNSVKYICADGTELDMSADYADYLVDGYAEVEFPKFNGTGMDGKTLVAYEEIYIVHTDETTGEEVESLVSEHKDIDDNDQTVRFPEIHTNADVEETNTKMVPIDGPVTINDTVTFSNLIIGKEYKLTAELVVKNDETGTYEDGDALLDKNSKPITAEITFVPENTDGEVVVPIIFDGYLMPEVEIVCFETLSNDKGLDIAVHNDIEDEDQTTGVVKIRTTAKTEGTDGQDTLATEETVIIDTVAYERLEPNLTYKVCGTLMQVSTGKELLDAEGNSITAETTFVPENSEGTVDVVFPAFDATELALEGDSIVVFERIYLIKTTEGTGEETEEGKDTEEEEILIGHHEDIEDEGQTIYIPEIHTTASDSETGDHVGSVSKETTIIDKVEYSNLLVGTEYSVQGKIYVVETGEPLLVDGKEVIAEKTFVAEKADGSVELSFTFDASALEGKTTVVFENIYRDKLHIATHESLDDKDQQIDFPKVRTKAEDSVTKENIGEAGKQTTIIDTVSFWNLEIGKEYKLEGTLMLQGTNEKLLVDGKPVTAEKTFVAETKDGTIKLEFTFDSSALEGETIIVFENLIHNNKLVCCHTDISDESQSEHHPSVKTTAKDKATDDHVGKAAKKVTIVDTVEYRNLIVGKDEDGKAKSYTVKGKLMDKDTGKEFLVNGKPVTAEKTFIPTEPNGTIDLEFTFDGSALEGKAVVVFEEIYRKGIRIGFHADLEDRNQTVFYPSIKTHVEDRTKTVQKVTNVTVYDDVMLSKICPNKRYMLEGVLMDKATGKSIMVDGKPVRVTKIFTAEAEDGMITMEFNFDATGINGNDVTVFEYLYLVTADEKNPYILVAQHADINDKDQSFIISPIPKTGDKTPVGMIFVLMILSGILLTASIWKKKKQ